MVWFDLMGIVFCCVEMVAAQRDGSAGPSANRYYPPDYNLNYRGFRPVVLWTPPVLTLKATSRLKERLE